MGFARTHISAFVVRNENAFLPQLVSYSSNRAARCEAKPPEHRFSRYILYSIISEYGTNAARAAPIHKYIILMRALMCIIFDRLILIVSEPRCARIFPVSSSTFKTCIGRCAPSHSTIVDIYHHHTTNNVLCTRARCPKAVRA